MSVSVPEMEGIYATGDIEDIPLVVFMYLVFTRILGESLP